MYGQEYCGTVLKCMFTVRVSEWSVGSLSTCWDHPGFESIYVSTWWDSNKKHSGFFKVSKGIGKNNPSFCILEFQLFSEWIEQYNPKTIQRVETRHIDPHAHAFRVGKLIYLKVFRCIIGDCNSKGGGGGEFAGGAGHAFNYYCSSFSSNQADRNLQDPSRHDAL